MRTKHIIVISLMIIIAGFLLSGFVFAGSETQAGQNQELELLKQEQQLLLEKVAELEKLLENQETAENGSGQTSEQEPAVPVVKVAYVIDEYPAVNVRADAGINYPLVERVPQKSPMIILDEKDDWYRVKLESGNIAWVASWVVRVQEE